MRPPLSLDTPRSVIAALALLLILAATAVASTETILHDFVYLPDGENPQQSLLRDSAGNLYGTTFYGGLYGFGVVFELSPGADGKWTIKVLHNFSAAPDGFSPIGTLAMDSAGNLYGITEFGGTNGCGIAYELSPVASGEWTETILHAFCASSTDGSNSYAGLTLDGAGNVYGTTGGGGANDGGTVFRLSPSQGGNWTEDLLYSFSPLSAGGSGPLSEVLLDSAGTIYGTTSGGGDMNCLNANGYPSGCGTIFELTSSGGAWSENVLYDFAQDINNTLVSVPQSRLLMDSAGNLYSVENYNTIFQLQPTTGGQWTFNVIQTLDVVGDLTMDSAGNLYGETPGPNNCVSSFCGQVFELQNLAGTWNLSTLYSFPVGNHGLDPCCVTYGADGNIYGVTINSTDTRFAGSVFELAPSAGSTWQESFLYNFPAQDGYSPQGDLVADTAGNLYGATSSGGKNAAGGGGVVFRLNPAENPAKRYDILYDFSLTSGQYGLDPCCGVIFDANGNLYGGAGGGGTYAYSSPGGSVFELSPTATGPWSPTLIYAFGKTTSDGTEPSGSLIFDKAGNLYGTTRYGGISVYECSCVGYGTVYELSPQTDGTWVEKQLYSFTGNQDGGNPLGRLVFDDLGNLYGVTLGGGSNNCQYTCGVVYKLTPNADGAWTESVIHSFKGTDGEWPKAGLIFDSAGNLYGTTSQGGSAARGVVFELSPAGPGSWTESTVYAFQGGAEDGAQPESDLSFDSSGNLYGTTYDGGPTSCPDLEAMYRGCGALFKLTAGTGGWTESIVHVFGSSLADGIGPASGVLADSNGNLFGMTSSGPGTNSVFDTGGTVFEITP